VPIRVGQFQDAAYRPIFANRDYADKKARPA
jgi:hypothetical protein